MGSPYDLSQAKLLSEDDIQFLHKLISTFIREMFEDIEDLKSGLHAQNRQKIRKAAHKMGSSAELFALDGRQGLLEVQQKADESEFTALEDLINKTVVRVQDDLIALKRDHL